MSCLTNDRKFSDLSVLRTKIYDFKLVYFFGTPGRKSKVIVVNEYHVISVSGDHKIKDKCEHIHY